ncbi:MAG: hypothetical protein ACT6Q6_19500, partial [Hydrogenophaga sp.]
SAPTLTWISNLDGAPMDWAKWGSRMADYWASHVRAPVAFESGARALAATQCDVHLEVGPNPTLIGLGMQCVPEGTATDWLPSLKRSKGGWEQMLDSVARLYVRGAKLNWTAVQGPGVRHSLELPLYPFQRQAYLVPFAPRARRVAGDSVHDLLGERLNVAGVAAQFERTVDA